MAWVVMKKCDSHLALGVMGFPDVMKFIDHTHSERSLGESLETGSLFILVFVDGGCLSGCWFKCSKLISTRLCVDVKEIRR